MSFQWLPTSYPVMWANTPDEVPEWDESRGCPLWAQFDEDENKSRESWLPRLTPPTWEVQPPPATGYPRLVRASLKERVKRPRFHNPSLLNDVSALYHYVDAWRAKKPVEVLKRKVLKLSETYGSVSGWGNTLTAWLELAAVIRLYRRLQRELKRGGVDDFTTEWIMVHTRLGERETIDQTEYKRRRRLAGEKKPVNNLYAVALPPILSNLDSVEEAEKNELEIIRARVKDKKEPRAIRAAIANGLYDDFGGALHIGRTGEKVILQHWGAGAFCHASVWARYALSKEWRHNVPLKLCPVCRMLFVPTQGNNIYCKPNGPCARKALEQRRKAQT